MENHFLDGRYFNLALRSYPGVVQTPLKIKFKSNIDTGLVKVRAKLSPKFLERDFVNIIRVVIVAPEVRHSALLLIDLRSNVAIFWNPKTNYQNSSFEIQIINTLREYLSIYGDINLRIHEQIVPQSKYLNGGYCNAYVIQFALEYLQGKKFGEFELADIEDFALLIEQKYKGYLTGHPDVEYIIGGPHVVRTAAIVGVATRR
jgi:hypothetical protein